MRGPEIELKKPAGIKRVAVLGDSFAWGWGVSENEMFTAILQHNMPGIEVLNFGVPGYGPTQYYLLRNRALNFEPDAVVIAFCLFNDFADSVFWERYGYYKPFARLDERGKLVIDGYPLPHAKRFGTYYHGPLAWMETHLHVFRLLDRHILGLMQPENFGQKGPAGFDSWQTDIYLHPEKPSTQLAVHINGELLKATAEAFQQRGIPIIVVAVPTKCELMGCGDVEKKRDGARYALAQIVSGLPVKYIDPTPAFEMGDFWIKDSHWRPSGHQKIASALLPALERALQTAR
jgi:hypothetical protein